MKSFIQEAYELLDENIFTPVIDGYKILNRIADDILQSCSTPLTKINSSTKCSKSVVPFAINSIMKGKETSLCLGNFGLNDDSDICCHAWVVSDGEILQTHVPNDVNPAELTAHIEIKLIPNDVNKSIELIKQKLTK